MQRCVRTLTTRTAHPISKSWIARPRTSSHRQWSPQHHPYSSVAAADLQFGQPVHETHPHLLKPGELTPGITAQEYFDRRNALAARLPAGGIAILAAADVKYKSKDVFYPYHQDSNFFYLTGFDEPDALAIIAKTSSPNDHEFQLYVREKDPKAEQWEGTRSGTAAARDVFNADHSHDISTSNPRIKDIVSSAKKIYTDIPTTTPSNNNSKSFLSRLTSSPTQTSSCPLTTLLNTTSTPPTPLSPLLHPLRLLKSPAELTLLRLIGRASGRSLTSTMSQPWKSEASLAAYLTQQFHLHNLTSAAYIPVVAGGPRGSIIHYVSNNQLLSPDSLVLVDAGGELGGYVTDITRTWPVSGIFSPAQRDLYTAVLSAQRSCIAQCRASASLSLDALHTHAETSLASSLSQLGFPTTGPMGKQNMLRIFPHHLGHYVGMDVHDTPSVSRKEQLREGMVVSVEPGVYVPDEEGWPERFRGLGVRVEDTVAVGEEGPVVLSVEAVKEVEDIEALRL